MNGDYIAGAIMVGLGILVLPALYKRLQRDGMVPAIVASIVGIVVWPIVKIKELVEG